MDQTKELIRIATAGDAEQIRALVNSVYRGDPSQQGWTTEAHLLVGERITIQQVNDIIASDKQVIMVAEIDKQIVGCVQLKNLGQQAYLGLLSVAVSMQASGLGSRILAASEKFVRDQWHCPKMIMWVLTIRTELVNWYLRKGYSTTSERVPYSAVGPEAGKPLVDGLEFVVLEKSLA